MSSNQGQPEPKMDVYSGVRWSAVAKYGTQAVDVVTSIIVARIVAPEAYGLLGMAIIITGFLMVFQSLGFGSALIQRKEINDTLTSSLFFVSLAVCLGLAAGLVAVAPLCSWVYDDDRVGPIVAVSSLMFVFSSLSLIPSSLLTRRLAFQRLAWVDISVSAVRAVSAISLALAGWGVWALVWSSIAGSAVHALFLYMACDWRPRWLFSWSEVRGVFGFGANLTGCSIFNYFARNADNFIIGAFLGATPLGYYSLAYRILLFPCDSVTGVLTRVLFPRLLADAGRRRPVQGGLPAGVRSHRVRYFSHDERHVCCCATLRGSGARRQMASGRAAHRRASAVGRAAVALVHSGANLRRKGASRLVFSLGGGR